MKRTPIRKRTRDPRKRLQTRADALLQDYYRIKWAKKPCEGCGSKMELVHHYVLKSHSNRLRYEEKNLIPLCKFCHSKVHGFHGELINAKIIISHSRKWLQKLQQLEREHISLSPKKLEEIIEKYKTK